MAEEFPFRYVPPVDPNLGQRVDHYFVLRTLLGRGGMGAAYLAEHEALAHIKCVIKLVLAELARHPMAISRYKIETEAVSRLKHDNIVKLQNFGVLEDGQLFMRFEYIEGKSLDRYVAERGGRLSLREAAYFSFQLCDALQYAHDVGVIHRDLKPDNLMIEASPPGSHLTERVKILDFGIAKVMASTTERTGSGVSMGTPRYMAPEQVINAAAATGRADVFSIAVIFYLLVTGKLPWGTPESDIAIYHKQKTEAPARPPSDIMPSEVTDLLLRALSLVPEERPSMREFAIELACAIPAESGLPSGTEILKDVKRSWVTSSLPHAQTLPRPAEDPTVALMPPQLAGAGAGLAGAAALHPDAPPAAPTGHTREHPPSASVHGVTASERPSSLASSAADARSSTSRGAPPAPVSPASLAATAREPSRRPPTAILAALPTGLVSQRFAAQEPPVESRASPVAVASEIEMATGTPGPQPYAHAELPAIVVSTTQLSAAPRPSAQPLAGVESVPILVLPGAQRPRRAGPALLLGGGLLTLAAAGSFFLTGGRLQNKPEIVENAPPRTPHVAAAAAAAADNAGPPRSAAAPDSGAAAEAAASPPVAVNKAAGPTDVEHPASGDDARQPGSPDASPAARPVSPHAEDKARAPLPEPAGSSHPTATPAAAT
jgi:serine/threonine protein kinase